MRKYCCPYCKTKYQFKLKDDSDMFTCNICGEEMVIKTFFNIKQITSLIIVITFISPLFYSFLLLFNRSNFKKDIYKGYDIELKKV